MPPDPEADPKTRRATRIVFFVAGFAMSAWAPLVPFARARVGIDEGQLGLLLLCLGIGSIATMPAAGAIAARLGCRAVILVAGIVVCVALPGLATASTWPWLVASLLLFGASVGAVDVTMNIQAIIVERAAKRPKMSGFHGLFSAGGAAGAAGITTMLSLGASPPVAMAAVVAFILAGLALAAPHLLRTARPDPGPAFAIPHGVVLGIGALCFVLFLTEGAMLDWSAVFLTSDRHVPPTLAGLGFAAFSVTMTLGRLIGDRAVKRFGDRRIVLVGGLVSAAGLAVVTIPAPWFVSLLGFALLGIGCSNIVPVLFTAIGRQKLMPESVAVPAVTTLGYAGILLGPAGIGFIAHDSSLPIAFLIVAASLVGVAFGARPLFK